MKKIILLLAISYSSLACSTKLPSEQIEDNKPKTKKVCIQVWDAKKEKEVEKCKTLKIHEKHEGNKVPQK